MRGKKKTIKTTITSVSGRDYNPDKSRYSIEPMYPEASQETLALCFHTHKGQYYIRLSLDQVVAICTEFED